MGSLARTRDCAKKKIHKAQDSRGDTEGRKEMGERVSSRAVAGLQTLAACSRHSLRLAARHLGRTSRRKTTTGTGKPLFFQLA